MGAMNAPSHGATTAGRPLPVARSSAITPRRAIARLVPLRWWRPNSFEPHPNPMRASSSSSSSSIHRPSPFRLAYTQTPFLTSLKKSFWNDDVGQAAEMLASATDADWTDLGDWACQFPDMDVKVRFLLEACQCMSHHQDKAAETLLNIAEELQQALVDVAHGPAALDHLRHAFTHTRWVDILIARPDLLERYRALLGKGPDGTRALCYLTVHMARRALFDQPGFVTRVPVYTFTFTGTVRKQKIQRDKAVQLFLYNAGKAVGRGVTLDEFEGIRCVWTKAGQPVIEVRYLPEVAETIRYYLGFGAEAEPYPEKPTKPKEAGFISILNQVNPGFDRLWLSQKLSQPTSQGTGSPIWSPFATRQEYAQVMEQLADHNLLICEDHEHLAALNFIYQNMAWLRKRGFTLCLENLPAELQNPVDDFLAGKPMSPAFKLMRQHYIRLLEKAKATGLPVLLVDSPFVRPQNCRSPTLGYQARSAGFKAFAADRIKTQIGSKKAVVLLGAFHAWIDNSDEADGVNIPGLQHALPNCKSVFIYDLARVDGKVLEEDEEEPFLIVTHDQKEKWTGGLDVGQYRIMADVYIGARRPLQMSIANSTRDGLNFKGRNDLAFPPDFAKT